LAPHFRPCQYLTTHFLQARYFSCRPANSVKALKAKQNIIIVLAVAAVVAIVVAVAVTVKVVVVVVVVSIVVVVVVRESDFWTTI